MSVHKLPTLLVIIFACALSVGMITNPQLPIDFPAWVTSWVHGPSLEISLFAFTAFCISDLYGLSRRDDI